MNIGEISESVDLNHNSRWLDRFARSQVLKQLKKIIHGELVWRDAEGEYFFGSLTERCHHRVTVTVSHQRTYADIAFGGSVGAGEAFMAGDWQCSNLTQFIELMICNHEIIDDMDASISPLKTLALKGFHWLNRNTHKGSKRNIEAHYDLGNGLFELFLDPSMMYSCAYYPDASTTLAQASELKLKMVCEKLALQPSDHLLEIGTGWGGMAIYAAKHYGCRVTTTTLSEEQYSLAIARIAEAGLQHRITVLKKDYRDLTGEYDKLVSIEMIEAIGAQYLDTYFAKCASLLKADGLMVLQAITIVDQRYKAALKSVDFIKRHIFPGCFIPAITPMVDSIARASDMKLVHLQDIGPHYARTLADWRSRFLHHLERVQKLGYSAQFIRKWLFYFGYCEAGFSQRVLGDVQMVLAKPGNRRF